MRRLLIFTTLFPPLALVVFIAPHLPDRDFLEIGLLCYMLGLAYVIVLIPAWLTVQFPASVQMHRWSSSPVPVRPCL